MTSQEERQRKDLNGLLKMARAALEPDADVSIGTGSVSGRRQGLDLIVRFYELWEAREAHKWTEVEVFLTGVSFTLELWPRKPRHKPGLSIEQKFDRAFYLTAAPANVARHVLDDEVRQRLMALDQVWIMDREHGFQLIAPKWLRDPELGRFIDLAVTIGAGAPAALEAAERELPSDGAPYRARFSAETVAAAKAGREAELAAVARSRKRELGFWRILLQILRRGR